MLHGQLVQGLLADLAVAQRLDVVRRGAHVVERLALRQGGLRELGDLVVDLSTRGDRATAVYRALLEAIRGGRLEPGERLPPTRTLAGDLGVARTTVATAYDRLAAEDTIATVRADFAAACERSREIAAEHPDLAEEFPWRRGPVSLRFIHAHMAQEYARHCGHGDILREQLRALG